MHIQFLKKNFGRCALRKKMLELGQKIKMRPDVPTVVKMKIQVFRDVMPSALIVTNVAN